MAHVQRHRHQSDTAIARRVQTEGVFKKCDSCGESVTVMALRRNLDVCPNCEHHVQIGAMRRIELTLDPGSFIELFGHLEALDPLEFKGKRSYLERVRDAQRKTGLKDAVVCGEGKIQGQDVVIAVMDFQFIGGSMGSVVGEKITRAIEHATSTHRPVILICCSGGARMDEGVLSLMQMAKTSAALYRHDQAGLVCITVLTHPTLAGVSASFAFLGDVIIAEPKAMIGFTGARVIEQTIKKKLPEGFQESEFLLEHGQIDMVVERKNMRDILAKLTAFATHKPARRNVNTAPLRIEPPVLAAEPVPAKRRAPPRSRKAAPKARKKR
ncbi:MAG TPA: acetyl-CoA carboxylase, carboxyltransferase subunit beta [Planctomycetota bacterium]|nr:acetyl-CoA carboxylase, carboxyltransferase subunit beta [Planctomycetota bacterium]